MNGLTHCIPGIFAIFALILLIDKALDSFEPIKFTGFLIFGLAMILLFTASTLYHWLVVSEENQKRLRKFDHIMIFIFIAATYTPFCLGPLKGEWGWSLLAAIWLAALLGVFLKLRKKEMKRWASTAIYVFMGWLVIFAVVPFVKTVRPEALFWVAFGGFFYTTGALIYALKKPNPWPKHFDFHAVWHVFVVVGSFSHFWAIYRYLGTPS